MLSTEKKEVVYVFAGAEVPARKVPCHQGNTISSHQRELLYWLCRGMCVVPFAMATAVLLDEEKFTNIEVTHGKLLNEGNVCAAVLVGMPGVGESLGLSENYWMDYAEITSPCRSYQQVPARKVPFHQGNTIPSHRRELLYCLCRGM